MSGAPAPPGPAAPPSVVGGTALGALGVVFGDIGTSPLYAFGAAVRAASPANGGQPEADVVLGLLSLVCWALLLVVGVKYVRVILRTDHDGEGGVLALLGLLARGRSERATGPGARALLVVAIVGAAMLFGDGVVTPAISVLSATEGLGAWSVSLAPWAVPLAVAILAVLFALQRAGAGRIGALFGPVMLAWFAVLAAGGALAITRRPEVLGALWPGHGIEFLLARPGLASAVLGAVFLAVTGGEALYADLGQFGRRAIARAWFAVALPALLLSYFGQGARLLGPKTDELDHLFFGLYPEALLLPVVLLATAATVIASQAVISGTFSVSRQAIRLGLLPRMRVHFHSDTNPHDVHLPFVNALLAILSLSMVVGFGSSAALASAYGISVAGAMVTTTVLYLAVRARRPASSRGLLGLAAFALVFVPIDIGFVVANLGKVADGGAVPLTIATVLTLLALSWRRGRTRQEQAHEPVTQARALAFADGAGRDPRAPPGVFLIGPGERYARAFDELVARCGASFSSVWLVNVIAEPRPRVPPERRVEVEPVADGVVRVAVRSGYLQRLDLPGLLGPVLRPHGIAPGVATWIVGLHRPLPAAPAHRPVERAMLRLYAVMARLAARDTDAWRLPPERTIEVGVPDVLEARPTRSIRTTSAP